MPGVRVSPEHLEEKNVTYQGEWMEQDSNLHEPSSPGLQPGAAKPYPRSTQADLLLKLSLWSQGYPDPQIALLHTDLAR